MVNYLAVNHELYVLAFTTSDDKQFHLIKNSIEHIPNSKKIYVSNGNQKELFVHKECYEQAIDIGLDFLMQNKLENNAFWSNKSDALIPCGYYQVAVATTIVKNKKEVEDEVKNYLKKVSEEIGREVNYSYSSLSGIYNISLQGTNYKELLLAFNEFVLKNGSGPFRTIESVSYYGTTEQRKFPILVKK